MSEFESAGDHTGGLDEPAVRTLLDHLIHESRLYHSGTKFRELLDFVVELRNFAPFNAMLLQIQKPGLRFAASAQDWRERFEREPKIGARPLLILWPFGPVAFVYDVMDTEGESLPEAVQTFRASGDISEEDISDFLRETKRDGIDYVFVDEGDLRAGSITHVEWPTEKSKGRYRISVNKNHPPSVQFSTLTHELAHLFLGHLGEDRPRRVTGRPRLGHDMRELEAESVAYLVCNRRGVTPNSEEYLSNFVDGPEAVAVDVYEVMKAAGRIESLVGAPEHSSFPGPDRRSLERGA